MSTSPDDPIVKNPTGLPRVFSGEGSANRSQSEYVALIASDTDMSQREVMRTVLTDVFQRNGRVIDQKLINEILDTYNEQDGGYDFNKEASGVQLATRKVLPGATDSKNNAGTSFKGYQITVDKAYQDGALAWIDAKYPQLPLDDKSPEAQARALEALKNLKLIAEAMGNGPAKEAIDALTQSIEARDGSALNGVGGAAAALKTVIELTKLAVDKDAATPSVVKVIEDLGGATKLGADAAEALGRTAGILTLPVDATKLGYGFYKLVQGKNEKGEPLTRGEYFNIGTDLLTDGLSTATGTAELLAAFGKGGSAASTLGAAAAPLAAVIAWGKLNYEVVKLGGQAISSTMEYEVASRFAEGKDGKTAFIAIEREKERVAKLPMGEENARRSAESIINNISNGDTRDRFIGYLKKVIEPDDYVSKIASTQGGEMIPPDQMKRLAERIQKSYPKFVEAEYGDVKNYVLQQQEGLVVFKTPQKRGEYLNKPLAGGDGVVDVTKQPTKPVETKRSDGLPELFPKLANPSDLLKGIDLKGNQDDKQPKLRSEVQPIRSPENLEKERRVVSSVKDLQLTALKTDQDAEKVAVGLQVNAKRDRVDIERVVASKDESTVFGFQMMPGTNLRTSVNVQEELNKDLPTSKANLASLEQATTQEQVLQQTRRNQLG